MVIGGIEMRVIEFLHSIGKEFPEPHSDGSISYGQFEEAGIPMVVSCTECKMTMVIRKNMYCDNNGRVYCKGCESELELEN
jgi:hypothetical protein